MHSAIKRKFTLVEIEGLPVGAIGRALQIDMETAPLRFTRGAQKHAHERHPEEFDMCLAHIERLVRSPLYTGDDLKNPGKFEIVSRLAQPDGILFILVAITIEVQDDGCYHVTSCYRLSEETVNTRRAKGRLSVVLYD